MVLYHNYSFSQENTPRILEIKKMYGEIIKLSTSNTSKQCKSGKRTDYEGLNEESKKFPFPQTAELCRLSKDYSTYHAKFCGYEWHSDTTYYLKDNKIFFVFSSSNPESCKSEYRVYYDLNGKVIRILQKSDPDCDGSVASENSIEIKDKVEMKSIVNSINSDFSKLLKILDNSKK